MVVVGQKLLFSGNSGCSRSKWLYSGKAVVNGKVVVFGQKWLYSGSSGSIRAKVVVFGQ